MTPRRRTGIPRRKRIADVHHAIRIVTTHRDANRHRKLPRPVHPTRSVCDETSECFLGDRRVRTRGLAQRARLLVLTRDPQRVAVRDRGRGRGRDELAEADAAAARGDQRRRNGRLRWVRRSQFVTLAEVRSAAAFAAFVEGPEPTRGPGRGFIVRPA